MTQTKKHHEREDLKDLWEQYKKYFRDMMHDRGEQRRPMTLRTFERWWMSHQPSERRHLKHVYRVGYQKALAETEQRLQEVIEEYKKQK